MFFDSVHNGHMTTHVDFWFDPICPFTWITSRWVEDVAQQRAYDITWHPFSLSVLNVGLDEGDDEQAHIAGHRMVRVAQAVKDAGHDVGNYYTAIGTLLHPGGGSHDVSTDATSAVIAQAIADAGLPAELAAAADDTSYDSAVTESTHEALSGPGTGVGIPIIRVADSTFFGPVFTKRPQGDAALKFWDAYTTIVAEPNFFEIKRQIKGELNFE